MKHLTDHDLLFLRSMLTDQLGVYRSNYEPAIINKMEALSKKLLKEIQDNAREQAAEHPYEAALRKEIAQEQRQMKEDEIKEANRLARNLPRGDID